MNYLFFDIECCDGRHICSFGYVICDENFRVLKKEDIIMNPEKEFKLGRAGFDPRIHLAYSENEFKKQKPFPYFYNKINQILKASNQIILGHSVLNDIKYLEIACDRYKLNQIYLSAYDTQKFYWYLDNKYLSRGQENIVKDLNINISDLHEHKSCDDAEISLRYTKEICKKTNCDINQLINSCQTSLVKYNKETHQRNIYNKKLNELNNKYSKNTDMLFICLSDTIKEKSIYGRLKLIEAIYQAGYKFTNRVSECSIFVYGNSIGKRDTCCDINIKDYNKKIKKISINELSRLINRNTNKNGEVI